MNRDEVIEKVRKLLRLAESDNEHEAALALSHALRFMEQYSIDSAELQEPIEFVVKNYEMRGASVPFERPYIFAIIKQHFHVVPIMVSNSLLSAFDKNLYRFIGTPLAIEIAEYIHDYLTPVYNRLWREYRAKMGKTLKRKTVVSRHKAYFYGISAGLDAKLRESEKQLREEGLVLLDDAKLQQFVKENLNPKLVKFDKCGSDQAKIDGYAAGKNIDIHKGVGGATEHRQLEA